MKICKDGRIWGQNNKEAGNHLGVLESVTHPYNSEKAKERHKKNYVKKGYNLNSAFKKGVVYPQSAFKKGTNSKRDGGVVLSGKDNPFYGKHHTEGYGVGEKNGNWQGGITAEHKKVRNGIEYRLWREAVYARDNFTCQKCHKRGGELSPHHIKSFSEYPELRLALDNGITLCRACHKLTPNWGGAVKKGRTYVNR